MLRTNYSNFKYNPNEIDEKEFLEKFVIRNDTFEEIFEDLQQSDYSVPNQHYIIIGQRGQGKTTLLRKIELEVKKDEKLSKFLLPVKFAEEQYQIRSLCRLWEEVADYLETIYEDEFENILSCMEKHFEDDNYDLKCFTYLENILKQKNKKLLLLIDNIDELLGKLKDKEQKQLREILLSSSSFRIVGGSTTMIEQHHDYAKPFYEFFNIIKLQGLDKEDSIKFLKSISNEEQKQKIERVIKNNPQKIETLRQLTGGVPRIFVMLFDIFVDEKGNAFEDLLKILDEVTPLYKHRMDDLSDIAQDIVHTLALNWDGMFTKDIAKKTRLESKAVSSHLKQLEKYQIVEAESIGKNKIYKIQERFFNIWYLMRFGRKKDRNRVEWLVRFLVSWYTPEELENRSRSFIESLKQDNVKESYAYHMCEALSYAGLDMKIEHNLKDSAKKYLQKINSDLANDISKSDAEILKEALEFEKNNQIEKAIDLLLKSKKTNANILGIIGAFYFQLKEYKKAEQYYLKALEGGDKDVLGMVGLLYEMQKEYKKAEEYYLKAIENGDKEDLNLLSWFYFEQAKNIDKSLEFAYDSYNKEKGFHNTYILATILLWNEEFSKSYEKFIECLSYKKAIEKEVYITNYFNLLISKGQLYKAKEFFEMEKYNLKDRFKPIWYALMTLMQDEFPNEIKKMGNEIKQITNDVLEEIEKFKIKYKI
jgi:TPR repeat protein